MKKRVILMVLAVVLALSGLFGCGNSSQTLSGTYVYENAEKIIIEPSESHKDVIEEILEYSNSFLKMAYSYFKIEFNSDNTFSAEVLNLSEREPFIETITGTYRVSKNKVTFKDENNKNFPKDYTFGWKCVFDNDKLIFTATEKNHDYGYGKYITTVTLIKSEETEAE